MFKKGQSGNPKGGKIGNPGGGRPKSETVKTISEFKNSKICELPKLWNELTDMSNDVTVDSNERAKIKMWKFEWLAGKPVQSVIPVDGEGQFTPYSIVVKIDEPKNDKNS